MDQGSEAAAWGVTGARATGTGLAVGAMVQAVGAAGVSGYVTWASMRAGALPAGCGPGSGCEAVLASPWSRVMGVPVGVLAMWAYVVLVLGLLGRAKLGARAAAAAAGTAVLAAGGWFVFLQAAVVGAWCAWCMTAHGVGGAAAVLGLIAVVQAGKEAAARGEAGSAKEKGSPVLAAAAAGVLSVGIVAAVQATNSGGAKGGAAQRVELPDAGDFDVMRDDERWVGVLDGRLRVGLHDGAGSLPYAGALDAEAAALVMFDYSCPHCREHLRLLDDYRLEHPDKLVRVALPVPLNSGCNPAWDAEWDEPAFAQSCRLAVLSFAVWRLDREAWPAYDRWLWDRDETVSGEEAAGRAVEVIGDAAAVLAEVEGLMAEGAFDPFAQAWDEMGTRLPTTLWPAAGVDAGAYFEVEDLEARVAEAIAAVDGRGAPVDAPADDEGTAEGE